MGDMGAGEETLEEMLATALPLRAPRFLRLLVDAERELVCTIDE